jgi:hypothetical protein
MISLLSQTLNPSYITLACRFFRHILRLGVDMQELPKDAEAVGQETDVKSSMSNN